MTIEDDFNQSVQAARLKYSTSLEDNPDDVGRALDLEKHTGWPAPSIASDIDSYESTYKSRLGQHMIDNNPVLQDWINAHPLNAALANDDIGNLDGLSAALKKLPKDPIDEAFKGFARGFNVESPPGEWFWSQPGSYEYSLEHPIISAAELAAGDVIALGGRVFSGLIEGFKSGVETTAQRLGASENTAYDLSRDLAGMAEINLMGGGGVQHMMNPREALKRKEKDQPGHSTAMEDFEKTRVWAEAGKAPPLWANETVDKFRAEQTKVDVSNLFEITKAARATNLYTRHPSSLLDIIRLHPEIEGQNVYISADAVRRLYGEKEPEAEDGVLGWVPDIVSQVNSAKASGTDVVVPVDLWATKIEEELAKGLKDDIKLRPDGVTVAETKLEKPPAEPKIKLEQNSETPVEGGKQKSYTVYDENDEDKMYFTATVNEAGTSAHINTIDQSGFGEERNVLKPSFMRGVLGEFLKTHPDLKEITADRVSGARLGGEYNKEKGVPIKFKVTNGQLRLESLSPAMQAVADIRKGAGLTQEDVQRRHFGLGVTGDVVPTELWGEKETELYEKMDKLLRSIAPRMVEHYRAENIEFSAGRAHGMYIPSDNWLPTILWSTGKDAAGTIRHEVIHHLNRYGFFTDEEWGTLVEASEKGDWIKKHDIDERYKHEDEVVKIEESIADEFSAWATERAEAHPLAKIFQKMLDFWKELKRTVGEVFGREATWEDLFRDTEKGKIGSRRGVEPVTKGQYWHPLAERLDEEDAEFEKKTAEDLKRKQQSKEWKDAASAVRGDAEESVLGRADVQADEFLRRGGYRADSKAIDVIAEHFGYQTRNELLDAVYQLREERGTQPPAEYLEKLIEDETNRRVNQKLGDTEALLENAKDHVLGMTQSDLQYELARIEAAKGKQKLPPKKEMRQEARDAVQTLPLKAISSDRFLADAGRTTRVKFSEGLDLASRVKQLKSIYMAQEARKIEKAKADFDKRAKRFQKRERDDMPEDFTTFAHDMLTRLGEKVKRLPEDLQAAIQRSGYKGIEEWYQHWKNYMSREIYVPDFMLNGQKAKLDTLTGEQFLAVHDSLKSIERNGRNEKKIQVGEEARDLAEVRDKLVDQLETFPEKPLPLNPGPLSKARRAVASQWARLMQIEFLFDRWDRGDRLGMFTQTFTRPLTQAGSYYSNLVKRFSKEIAALKKFDLPLDEKIPNNVFSWNGRVFDDMTRKNLRAVMSNIGTEKGLKKLADGYGIKDPQKILDWVKTNAKEEDWRFVKAQGEIFGRIKRLADTMVSSMSGVPAQDPKFLAHDTPIGRLEGWYHPTIYDRTRKGEGDKIQKDALQQPDFVRAATPRKFEKEYDTGNPISLQLDEVPVHMSQMLRDIAFRPAITEASKLFLDNKFQNAVTKHYGEVYRDLLPQYLIDIGNQKNYDSRNASIGTRILENIRQNLVGTLIGFNPGTVAKHGITAAINSLSEVGIKNFSREAAQLLQDTSLGEKNWSFAMSLSEELQRRHQNWAETLGGAHEAVMVKGGWDRGLRQTMLEWGAKPVAFFDLLSAVPTWLASYKEAKGRGLDEGTAIFLADTSVRRAHGSSAITSRPELMRGGASARWITSLYGFFSHVLNRQFELAWKSKEGLQALKAGDMEKFQQRLPQIAMMTFSYVILPAVIEQMVQHALSDKKDKDEPGHTLGKGKKESWGDYAAKTLTIGLSSPWPIARDFAHFITEGYDPSLGLFGTAAKEVADTMRDMKDWSHFTSKQKQGKTLQHMITIIGLGTGWTNAQEARTAKFLWDYHTGHEKPKNARETARGIWHGTVKERAR